MNVNFVVSSPIHREKPDLAIVMQDEQVGGALHIGTGHYFGFFITIEE